MWIRFAAAIVAASLAADAGANSNGTTHTTRTWRDVQSQPTPALQDSNSCGGCHGARGTITVSLAGPASLAAGATGSYTVSVSGGTANDFVGVVVSTTDAVATNPFSGAAPLVTAANNTIVHNSVPSSPGPSTLTRVSGGGTASYAFNYTMPAAAIVGGTRRLHAVVRTGVGANLEGRWNHANIVGGVPQGLVVTTAAAPPSAPTSLTNPSKTATTAQLAWSGSGPAYRLVYRTGVTAPATPTDGTTVDLGNVTSTTVSGLTLGPTYSFRIYSRLSDNSQFTAGPALTVTLPPAVTSSLATINGTVNSAIASYSITGSNSPTSYGATGLPTGVNFTPGTGLVSGTPTAKGTYPATISASNGGGTGTASKTWQIAGLVQTITFGPAPSPTYSPGGTFTVTASSNAGLPLTFSALSPACSVQSATATSATLSIISAGNCQVEAREGFGNAQYDPAVPQVQNVSIAAVAPGSPTNVNALPGNGSAAISFLAPTNDGGSAITSYTATCTPGPFTATGSASPLVVTGLANGTPYSCSVKAANVAGPGPASASVMVTPTADPDGSLDAGFASGGLTAGIFASTGTGESARALAVDSELNIYVGGGANPGTGVLFAVAKYFPDGTPDNKFGTGGVALLEAVGTGSTLQGLAVDRDGRILFAGAANVSGNDATFTIGRLQPDGRLDESFGAGGFLKLEVSAMQGVATHIAQDPNTGAVLAAGWDKAESQPLRAVIVRTDDRGVLDGGFGDKGVLHVPLGAASGGSLPQGGTTGFAIDPAGRAVVGGFAGFTTFDAFAIRVDAAGLDESFGSGGITVRDIEGAGVTDVAFTLRVDEKGRTNLAGYTFLPTGADFAVVRLDENGNVESEIVADQGTGTDLATGLVVLPDGKRLVGGMRLVTGQYDFAFAKFLDDGSPDTSYAGTGRSTVSIPGTDQLLAMENHRPGTVVALVQTGGISRLARFVHEAPLPFAFSPPSVTAIGTNSVALSNAVTLEGLAGETYVKVQGGEWSPNCDPFGFTTLEDRIGPGTTVCVRHTTAASIGVPTTTTLTVGGQSATFTSTPNSIGTLKTLTVSENGGFVRSTPLTPTQGIACPSRCSSTFAANTPVALTASPGTGRVFSGWSGSCTGTGACILTMDSDKSVTAAFGFQQVALSVSKAGAGGGTVVSDLPGINCGAACNANFNYGREVTLTPTPATGSVFTGWSGACTGPGPCTVTMDAVRSVTATFALQQFSLTVTPAGAGSGSVASTPSGISCGAACSFAFDFGTVVALVPTPAAGSVFSGWSGACTGTGACNVTMSAARSVTANFAIAPPSTFALTVAKMGGGAGTVTSNPAGINCGAACTSNFNSGATVALTASAAAGSFFNGWSGACTGAAACNVTMDAAKSVTATFKLNTTIPRLANISTRMQVLTGADVLIGGFIIGGTQAKTVVVRARGPSLTAAGVPGALGNPVLQLFSGPTQIDANDNWQQAANAATIQSSGFAPADPLESAIHTTLGPGAYTAIVTGANLTTGVAIIEVFEVGSPEVPLLNIATRGKVLTGADVMIGGFIIQGDAPQTVVVRARGPSLAAAGVPGALQDPVLQLFAGASVIAANDDWQAQAIPADVAAIQSSGFAPGDTRESVIRITLNPGAYTAIVTGKNGATGVGIIEVFAQ